MRLSCQMTRAKNATGNPFAAAADSIIWQMEDGSAALEALSRGAASPAGIVGRRSAGRPPESLGSAGAEGCAVAAVTASQDESTSAMPADLAFCLVR